MEVHGPILVALDGSESAERVVVIADTLATALRSHLALLTVMEETPGIIPGLEVEIEKAGREHYAAYLNDMRNRLSRSEIRTAVRVGNASDEILSGAEEMSAGIIAVATHGRSGIGRWMYGSTAANLLHRSTMPLLVVGPHARTDVTSIRSIVVPLDGGRLSEAAAGIALKLRESTGARVALVRAVPWAVQSYPYSLPSQYIPELDAELERGASEYLSRMQKDLGGKVITHVVRGGAADSLLQFVEREAPDLVVMTTQGRGGAARGALGSIADRMLQCVAPVLLVRERPAKAPA